MRTDLPKVNLGNITLRELCEADYFDYFFIGSNPEVVKYLNWGPLLSMNDSIWVFNEVFLKRPLNGLPIGYAICNQDKMIGVIDFHTYYLNENACEIGYILHKDYWNKGIMTRALKEVCKIGFYHLCLDKLIVGHVIENEASKRVILKAGFHYECQKLINQKNQDTIALYYSMYSYEYKKGKYD